MDYPTAANTVQKQNKYTAILYSYLYSRKPACRRGQRTHVKLSHSPSLFHWQMHWLQQLGNKFLIKPWPNTIKYCLMTKHFTVLTPCLALFDRVWSWLTRFQGYDVLFVWTAAYQTCLMRACVPRLLSGLYQLFDLCLIKHGLTVWPLTSTSACLVTKQCLMVIGRQTFVQGFKYFLVVRLVKIWHNS